MTVECNQCLWQGTKEEWDSFGGCPNCPCQTYTIIDEYGK